MQKDIHFLIFVFMRNKFDSIIKTLISLFLIFCYTNTFLADENIHSSPEFTINYDNVSIIEYIQFVSKICEVNFIYKKRDNKNWAILSILSISACAISLYFQIFYNNYLVKIEDWSALMDTTGAVAFISAILLVGTIILNTINLMIYCYKVAS